MLKNSYPETSESLWFDLDLGSATQGQSETCPEATPLALSRLCTSDQCCAER